MENEVVVEENILAEVVEETKEQKIPELNYEFLQANGIDQNVIDRFWKKIKFPDDLVDGCWFWTAAKNKKGYGRFGFTDILYQSHRFSYMIFKGEICEGLCIRHTCNNPSCVNPHHLLDGTNQDNVDDMTEQDRQAKGEDHGMAKLTEIEVDEIFGQLLQKFSKKGLSIQYNVSEMTIYKISIGKSWKKCYDKLSESQKQQLKPTRLSLEDTEEIRELYETMTQVNLAIKFKVSVSVIIKTIKKIPPYDY